ncbi:MAG: helix-turn-helix domain-containing protein [bacterium]|nr:helix-turn-helix domain-containing protein [bacterium]MCM1375982.1 helix-turn-helix domain-containing protein [Muribaculum sp.]
MQIKLGEKIKELRGRDRRKQEDLAIALGVTNQAVSRWEANGGYPDIELLPAIANYFHITIDELFGYDSDRQTKLQTYIEQADRLFKHGDNMPLVEFLRDAISEFPSEWQLQYRLANALVSLGHQKSDPHKIVVKVSDYSQYNAEYNAQNEYWKEAVSLFEEVLKQEIDDDIRTSAICSLMWLYSWMGDQENAERTALSQSPVRISREVLLADTTVDQTIEKYSGEAILALMHELYKVLRPAVMGRHSLSHSQAGLDVLLAVVRLYEGIFDDGNYGMYHNDMCMLYLHCSSIAVHLNDSERALSYYEVALDHFLEFKQIQRMPQLTAPLINKAKDYRPSIVLLDREWFEEHMQAFPVECVDAIKNNPKYAAIFAQ